MIKSSMGHTAADGSWPAAVSSDHYIHSYSSLAKCTQYFSVCRWLLWFKGRPKSVSQYLLSFRRSYWQSTKQKNLPPIFPSPSSPFHKGITPQLPQTQPLPNKNISHFHSTEYFQKHSACSQLCICFKARTLNSPQTFQYLSAITH